MKNFLEHLTQVEKTYEFRIKLADIDPSEHADRLKTALDAYGLESLSDAKRLPIQESDIDFPSMANCQIYLMDAVLKYPVTDAQLRAIVSERGGIPAGKIVVVPKNHPEEQWRWDRANSDIREFKKGESVLDKDFSAEECACAEDASKAYSEAGSLLKELNSIKFEVAGSEKADGKTTNDIPVGDVSPVGSKQNTIPTAVKGK